MFVWTDAGRPLSQSPSGPWLDGGTKTRISIEPVIQYKPRIAFREHQIPTSTGTRQVHSPEPFQSALLLPFAYGRSLDPGVMEDDPLYALQEVLLLLAVSELKVLEVVASKIQLLRRDPLRMDTLHLDKGQRSLIQYRHILEKHDFKISEIRRFLTDRHIIDWPRSSSEKAQQALLRVEQDYEHLQQHCRRLESQCEREMNILMNVAGIAEARHGINQANKVSRFTLIASVYVPLSFTCAIFGMNFIQFSSLWKGLWIWLIVTLPLFAITCVILTWNRRRYRRLLHKAVVFLGG